MKEYRLSQCWRLALLLLTMLTPTALWAAAEPSIRNLHLPRLPNELLVGFDAEHAADAAVQVAARFDGQMLHRFHSSTTYLFRFSAHSDADLHQLARKIAAVSGVRFVEANTLYRAVTNDPRFGEQYGLKNTGQSGGLAGMDIDIEAAWRETKGSHEVVVAVIDTGIDQEHPDLMANLWANPGETGRDSQGQDKRANGVDDDGNGYIDDFRGWDFVNNDNNPDDDNGHSHGTHCAGVIGAQTNNAVGIAGINWHVSLVGIKFLDASGGGSLANAIRAVEYATQIGAKISSNSWGGGGFSEALEAAIIAAEKAGSLFIAAAGNDGVDTDDSPHFPSSYAMENLISVAAIDRSGKLASFSNYGKRSVDLAAPGVDILSTTRDSEYRTLSGTSMATPHVSGVAALIWSAHPQLSARQVKDRILNASIVTDGLKSKTISNGRLNAAMAVETDLIPPSAVSDGVVTEAFRQSLTMQWRAAGDDGDIGQAHAYEARFAAEPIIDESVWARATQLDVETLEAAGQPVGRVSARVNGFGFNDAGFLAIRARDNVGNLGPLSEAISFEVERVRLVGRFRPENLGEVGLAGSWGAEQLADRRSLVFSDSPGGKYGPNLDSSLLLPVEVVDGTGYAVAFETAADLERGYDFGRVEIQVDQQGEWQLVKRFTDHFDWREINLPLDAFLTGATSFQLRFRFTSDGDIEEQGWWIDDITVLKND